jgi:hypothetical protein
MRRPMKFSGRRTMTSISWAFEIIEKFTDMVPYSCVTFGVIGQGLRDVRPARAVASDQR